MKEENTRPVLSISLLCSGRNREEMTKCLDSLMTIRTRMSSEIVVVDTGCGPDTKPLLGRYADKVVEFTWCDDFAKARNAGLKECTGEWFMFIDDDEQFENTDAIVDFFNSGEYRKYDKAEYIIRNFINSEKTAYADVWLPRIVRHTDELHFHGKIHEFLTPVGENSKKITCIALHSGYQFPTKADLYKKAQRNIPPLLEMMKKEPNAGIWRAQLIQEYKNISDFSSMEQLCLSTLDEISKSDMENAKLKGMMYEGALFAEIQTYQFDKAISNLKDFLSDKDNSEKCIAGLCFYGVEASLAKKSYRSAYTYAQRYLDIYDKISKIEDTSIDDMTFMCGNVFEQRKIMYCIAGIITAGVRIGNLSVIYEYFDRFDLGSHDEPIVQLSQGMNYAFSHFDFDEIFVTYASKMCRNTYIRELLLDEVRKSEKEDSKRFDKYVQIYGRIDSADDIYILYLRLLYAYRYDRSKLNDIYKLIFDCVLDFFDMDPSIWHIADEVQIDLVSYFKNVPFIRWKKAVDLLMDEHFDKRQETVSFINEKINGDNNLRFDYFRLKLEEKSLNSYDGRESAAALLNSYCTDCVTFYLKIYKPELFTGDLTVLPQECQFAMQFIKVVSNEQNYSPLDYIKALEKCAALDDSYAEVMKAFISDYGEIIKAELGNRL